MITSVEDKTKSTVGDTAGLVTSVTGLRKILAVVRVMLRPGVTVICLEARWLSLIDPGSIAEKKCARL
jgi:hypothetical protein